MHQERKAKEEGKTIGMKWMGILSAIFSMAVTIIFIAAFAAILVAVYYGDLGVRCERVYPSNFRKHDKYCYVSFRPEELKEK